MKKIPQLSDGPDDDLPDDDSPADRARVDARAGARTPGSTEARPDGPSGEPSDASSGPLAEVREALSAEGRDGGERASGAASGSGTAAGAATPPPQGGGRAPHGGKRKGRGKGPTARGPARRFARERALQALYQWDMADAESSTVRREFIERQDMSRVDVDYFERLFRGVSHDVEKVDATLADALDRPLGEVDPIERAVLRIAAFELAEVLETPARVVINEGVEITKRFGADNGHRYVNGVLDGLAATLRPLEMRRG